MTFRTIVPQALGHEAARRRAVLLAVLPAGVVALLGLAAGAFLASRGTLTGVAESTAWWLLLASALVTVVIVVGAGWAAAVHARAVAAREAEKIAAARRAAEAAERELAAVRELAAARRGRVGGESDDSAERFEVFDNLARRLQSLVHREIGLLDDLENQVEDPDLLKGMFQVDHLATRVRRYAENLASPACTDVSGTSLSTAIQDLLLLRKCRDLREPAAGFPYVTSGRTPSSVRARLRPVQKEC